MAKVWKPIKYTTIFPLFIYNSYKDIRFAVLLDEDGQIFDLLVEDTSWNELPYFAPTRSIADDHIDNFTALIHVNDQKILDSVEAIGW